MAVQHLFKLVYVCVWVLGIATTPLLFMSETAVAQDIAGKLQVKLGSVFFLCIRLGWAHSKL